MSSEGANHTLINYNFQSHITSVEKMNENHKEIVCLLEWTTFIITAFTTNSTANFVRVDDGGGPKNWAGLDILLSASSWFHSFTFSFIHSGHSRSRRGQNVTDIGVGEMTRGSVGMAAPGPPTLEKWKKKESLEKGHGGEKPEERLGGSAAFFGPYYYPPFSFSIPSFHSFSKMFVCFWFPPSSIFEIGNIKQLFVLLDLHTSHLIFRSNPESGKVTETW